MTKQFDNLSPQRLGVICGILCIFWTYSAHSAFLVPTSLSGAISYGYGYNKAAGGSESESQNVTVDIAGAGFIWQPWFIQTGASLAFGFTRTNSSTSRSSSSSRNIGGSMYLNVFPVSRFPFSLSLSHGNSRFSSGEEAFAGIPAYESESTQLFVRQGYFPRSGYDNNISWAHNRLETISSTSVSDSVVAETRKSYQKSSWTTTANYSTVDVSDSSNIPENWGLRFIHRYTPGNQTSISSNVGGWGNRNKGAAGLSSESLYTQASSAFSWRPEYRPYNFSGGARISSSESKRYGDVDSTSTSNSASLSLGVNYRLSRKVSIIFTSMGTGGSNKTDGVESTSTSANAGVSTSYNSDMFTFGGFQYFWNTAGGLNTNYVSTKISGDQDSNVDTASTSAAGGVSLGHRISRGWSLGKSTSMSTSLSQSVSGSGSDDGTKGWGTGVGGDISGSSRGIGGTTFAGISGSYSYSKSITEIEGMDDTEIESLYARANLSRNQTLSRLSALTASATTQWRRQLSTESDDTTRSADASVNYRHQRFLGIYALNYDSLVTYIVTFNPGEDEVDIIEWRNTWRYTVGLLDLSLFFDIGKQGDTPTRGSVRFRATRSF